MRSRQTTAHMYTHTHTHTSRFGDRRLRRPGRGWQPWVSLPLRGPAAAAGELLPV